MFVNWRGLLVPLWLAGLVGCWLPAWGEAGTGSLRDLDSPQVIDIGNQPLSHPLAVVAEVLRRDRVLREELAREGLQLRLTPFHKGGDMLPLLGDGRLEGAMLGDLPTISASVRHGVQVVGMLKQAFSSLVATRYLRLAELRGKRIGYAVGSSAHYIVLQGLGTAGLGEQDVTLVPMEMSEMPAALADGRLDLFASWEPAPTVALSRIKGAAVVYRGLTTTFFVLTPALMTAHPNAAQHLGAALLRAVNWLRGERARLDRAVAWTLAAGEAFAGVPAELTAAQAATIARRELLEVPGLPFIDERFCQPDELLAQELGFMRERGQLPVDADWARLREAIRPELLRQLAAEPDRWRLTDYHY